METKQIVSELKSRVADLNRAIAILRHLVEPDRRRYQRKTKGAWNAARRKAHSKTMVHFWANKKSGRGTF